MLLARRWLLTCRHISCNERKCFSVFSTTCSSFLSCSEMALTTWIWSVPTKRKRRLVAIYAARSATPSGCDFFNASSNATFPPPPVATKYTRDRMLILQIVFFKMNKQKPLQRGFASQTQLRLWCTRACLSVASHHFLETRFFPLFRFAPWHRPKARLCWTNPIKRSNWLCLIIVSGWLSTVEFLILLLQTGGDVVITYREKEDNVYILNHTGKSNAEWMNDSLFFFWN